MQVHVGVEIGIDAQDIGPAADVGHAGFSRFLHDVAELAREQQAAFALDGNGFRFQDFTADLGPGHACDDTDFVIFMDRFRQEFHGP